MSSGVRLHVGNDLHPRNAHPKMVPINHVLFFMMIVTLIFYFHMKVNGHEILESTNTAKLS